MKKIRNIEFLRFLAASIIVIEHLITLRGGVCLPLAESIPLYETMLNKISWPWVWTSLFFIFSGFFLFYTTDFKVNITDFVKKKIARLVPVIIFTVLIFWVLSWFHIVHFDKYMDIYTILLLNCVGLTTGMGLGDIPPTWYVSSLFWAMLFFYSLKQLVSEKWFAFITGFLTFFAYIISVNYPVHCSAVVLGFINSGLLTALGGIGLGYFICLFWKNYENKHTASLKSEQSDNTCGAENICTVKSNIFKSLIFTGFEIYILVFLIQDTLFHRNSFRNFSVYILAFIALTILFLIKKGFISKIMENNLSVILGRYTYSIFIMQTVVMVLYRILFMDKHTAFAIAHPIMNIMLPYILTLITGVITYHLIEKPAFNYLKNNWFNFSKKEENNF